MKLTLDYAGVVPSQPKLYSGKKGVGVMPFLTPHQDTFHHDNTTNCMMSHHAVTWDNLPHKILQSDTSNTILTCHQDLYSIIGNCLTGRFEWNMTEKRKKTAFCNTNKNQQQYQQKHELTPVPPQKPKFSHSENLRHFQQSSACQSTLKHLKLEKMPFVQFNLHHIKTLSIIKTQQTTRWVMMSKNLPYKIWYLDTSSTVLTLERETGNNKNIKTNMNAVISTKSQSEWEYLTPSTVNHLNGSFCIKTNPSGDNNKFGSFTVCVSFLCHHHEFEPKPSVMLYQGNIWVALPFGFWQEKFSLCCSRKNFVFCLGSNTALMV